MTKHSDTIDQTVWAEMTTQERIAEHFVFILQEWLTETEWQEMRQRNAAETSPLVCHSHDFCDANMAMDEAFFIEMKHHVDGDNDVDTALWNEAWEIAKHGEMTGP